MSPRVRRSHIRGLLTRGMLVLSLSAAGACGLTDPALTEIGTVVFVDVEGGCWGLDTTEGRVEPRNLPEEFRIDGLRVRFEAVRVLDVASICQIGPIVDLVSVRRIP